MKYTKYCTRNTLRCEENIGSHNYRYSSYGKNSPICCTSHLVEILFFVTSLLEEHNIPYFICWGTHLGAVRHQGLIPWDTDTDIGIFSEDYERVNNLVSIINEKGFCLRYSKTTECLTTYYSQINELHLDIETWEKQGDTITWQNYSIEYNEMFPLKKYKFYDRYLFGPNSLNYLFSYYGADCLESVKKQWMYWDTRLWNPNLANGETFKLIDNAPALIDLQRNFEEEEQPLSIQDIIYQNIVLIINSTKLWKLLIFWVQFKQKLRKIYH